MSLTFNCGSTRTLSIGRHSNVGTGTVAYLTSMFGGSSVGMIWVEGASDVPPSRLTVVALRVLLQISFQSYPHFQMPVPRWAICSSPHLVCVLKSQSLRMKDIRLVFASVTSCGVPG